MRTRSTAQISIWCEETDVGRLEYHWAAQYMPSQRCLNISFGNHDVYLHGITEKQIDWLIAALEMARDGLKLPTTAESVRLESDSEAYHNHL